MGNGPISRAGSRATTWRSMNGRPSPQGGVAAPLPMKRDRVLARPHAPNTKRLTTLRPGTSRVLHRHGPRGSTFQGARTGPSERRLRHLRAVRAQQLAYASAGADAHRHLGLRLRAELGWPDPGHSAWRRRLVPTGREALARRLADHVDDAHRHPGGAQWQGRGLAGKSE